MIETQDIVEKMIAHNEIEIDLFSCVDRKGKKRGARTGIALLLSTASGTLEEPFVSIENFDARVAYTRGGEESSRDDDSEEMLATCIFASKESCCRKRRGGRREEEKRKKEKRSDRGCFFDSRLVERRSPDTGGMLVRRAGELFRKQARPSPSSNGRESISGLSPVERKELFPTGQDLCPTYI